MAHMVLMACLRSPISRCFLLQGRLAHPQLQALLTAAELPEGTSEIQSTGKAKGNRNTPQASSKHQMANCKAAAAGGHKVGLKET